MFQRFLIWLDGVINKMISPTTIGDKLKVRIAISPRMMESLLIWTQLARLAREDDEDGLGDFLGQMRVAHLPQRRRMNERHMAFHELRKGGLGLAGGELGEQFGIGR